MWTYYVRQKKEKVEFSSLLSINQKLGMTLKRWLNISDPMEIAQKENVYGVDLLKSNFFFYI